MHTASCDRVVLVLISKQKRLSKPKLKKNPRKKKDTNRSAKQLVRTLPHATVSCLFSSEVEKVWQPSNLVFEESGSGSTFLDPPPSGSVKDIMLVFLENRHIFDQFRS